MACILLWSSVVRVHDSQAYRKMDVTRERISRILQLKEILLSLQTGFNLVNAAVVCTTLENTSGLEPSSVITEPRYLKLVIVSSFCPFTLISVLMPLVLLGLLGTNLHAISFFIDFKKAFDRVWHIALLATMKKYNISTNFIRVIKNLYDEATSAVFFNSSIGDCSEQPLESDRDVYTHPPSSTYFWKQKKKTKKTTTWQTP